LGEQLVLFIGDIKLVDIPPIVRVNIPKIVTAEGSGGVKPLIKMYKYRRTKKRNYRLY